MSKPLRIEISRKRGYRMPPNTRKVARPSRWANIFRISDPHPHGGHPMTRADVIQLYAEYVAPHADIIQEDLRGQNLGCFCNLCPEHKTGKPFDFMCLDCQPCHTDTLLEIANR